MSNIADLKLHELVGQSDMTLGELITSYKQAPKKNLQLHALAELTLLPEEEIVELLLANGVKQQELPRARKPKAAKEAAPENFRGGWTRRHPSRNPLRRSLRRCLTLCAAWWSTATPWPQNWTRSTRSWPRCAGC